MSFFRCPHCLSVLSAPDNQTGATLGCPQCGQVFEVLADPNRAGQLSAAPPPLPPIMPPPAPTHKDQHVILR